MLPGFFVDAKVQSANTIRKLVIQGCWYSHTACVHGSTMLTLDLSIPLRGKVVALDRPYMRSCLRGTSKHQAGYHKHVSSRTKCAVPPSMCCFFSGEEQSLIHHTMSSLALEYAQNITCRGNELVCFKVNADVGGYDELEKGRMNLLEASNCVLSHVMDGKSL